MERSHIFCVSNFLLQKSYLLCILFSFLTYISVVSFICYFTIYNTTNKKWIIKELLLILVNFTIYCHHQKLDICRLSIDAHTQIGFVTAKLQLLDTFFPIFVGTAEQYTIDKGCFSFINLSAIMFSFNLFCIRTVGLCYLYFFLNIACFLKTQVQHLRSLTLSLHGYQ